MLQITFQQNKVFQSEKEIFIRIAFIILVQFIMFLSDPNNFLIQLVEKDGAFGMFFGLFKSCPPQTALSNEGEKITGCIPNLNFVFCGMMVQTF